MTKFIYHANGKIYEVCTQNLQFAEIRYLEPRYYSGMAADLIQAIWGKVPYEYIYHGLEGDNLTCLTLELGPGFSISSSWSNLYNWAYAKQHLEILEG